MVRTVLSRAEETHLVHNAADESRQLLEGWFAFASGTHLGGVRARLGPVEPAVDAVTTEAGFALLAHLWVVDDLHANLTSVVVSRVLIRPRRR